MAHSDSLVLTIVPSGCLAPRTTQSFKAFSFNKCVQSVPTVRKPYRTSRRNGVAQLRARNHTKLESQDTTSNAAHLRRRERSYEIECQGPLASLQSCCKISYHRGSPRMDSLGQSGRCCCPGPAPHDPQDAKSRCVFS